MRELLVVIDMQDDFITGVLGSAEAGAIVPKVCEKIKGWTGDIIMTRDTHHDDYLATAEGRTLPVPHCIEGSEGWHINADVKNSYDKKKGDGSGHFFSIFDKSAFGSMLLAEFVKGASYGRIVLCGLCTDICAISNAMLCRSACPEAVVEVDASCCAGVCPQSHKVALEAMAPCNIRVSNV